VRDVTVMVHLDLSEVHEKLRLVEILRVQPDDVIVLTLDDGPFDMAQIDGLRMAWREGTALPNKVIVLDGAKASVLRGHPIQCRTYDERKGFWWV
jgi:hypothetical protein